MLRKQKGFRVFNHTLALVLHDYIKFGCEENLADKEFAKQALHELIDVDILTP